MAPLLLGERHVPCPVLYVPESYKLGVGHRHPHASAGREVAWHLCPLLCLDTAQKTQRGLWPKSAWGWAGQD